MLPEVFNVSRHLVRYGVAWRVMPNDLPPCHAAYDQVQRWSRVGCFDMLIHDLRAVLRFAAGRRTSQARLRAAAAGWRATTGDCGKRRPDCT